MSLTTNFSSSPYYDDFDPTKKYLRMLFKPGYAVQSRELTQIQSILQNQIKNFGDHIFKNGSVVTGGQFFLQFATYLKLNPVYSGVDVNYLNFEGKTITSIDESKRAEVIKVYAQTDVDPITLMVKQVYGEPFTSLETIKTKESSPYFATILSNGVGTGQIFSVTEGVYFYDGYFINTDAQTIATSKYSASTATAKIGFEITESIVNYNQDTSLLDPALDASNYQAPGSDRYKIDLVLASRDLNTEDDEKFIELMQVQNGISIKENKYPIYSVLEETLARRTYDESGNYTTKSFKLALETNSSNTAQTNVILSPGKAYVYGYEFETVGPTTLIVDKPRSTEAVGTKRLTSDYGNYVYTTNHFGAFKINDLQTIDVHCVNSASINVSTTGTISNTKIGTVRVKSIAFDSSANTSDSSTYIYRTYIFDTDIGSITGVLNIQDSDNDVANNRTIHYLPSGFLNVKENCFAGAKFRITSGDSVDTIPRTIQGGPVNVAGKAGLYVEGIYDVEPAQNSNFSVDFEFNDAESFASFSGTTKTISADISDKSKDSISTYNDTIIFESAYEPLIFPLGESYIADNSIDISSMSYKKLFTGTFNSSSELDLSGSLSTGETLSTASTLSSKQQNYFIVITAAGGSSYVVGQVVPVDKFTISGNTITVDGATDTTTASIIATVDVSEIGPKVKTYVTANTTILTESAGRSEIYSGNIISYVGKGQIQISTSYVNKIPGLSQSLFAADVTEIVAVKDFNGMNITEANSALALDVTSNYVLDNGQRDSYYDHGAIILKSNYIPVGPLVVFYNRLSSTGAGYFSVDSYDSIGYENIPVYNSVLHNKSYNLRDCLDFRPVRADNSTTLSFASTATKIPENGSDIILDYQYYLGRIDKIVLDKTKVFDVIKGIPSINPVTPNDSSTGMTLFILRYPPYTISTNEIGVQHIEHRRYTMRDIGNIDKRVQNIEYYTALSLLEQETISKQDLTILDSQNLQRFKNGILVDSFVGHAVADVINSDYSAAIDKLNKELRPRFNIQSHRLNFDSANSTNYTQKGSLVTLQYSDTAFIDQPRASRSINVNPFNVVNYLGKISLYPTSDIWIDTEQKPDVIVNLGGNNDAWDFITEETITYEWGDWNTVWTGVDVDTSTQTVVGDWSQTGRRDGSQRRRDITIYNTTTTTTTQNQTRTGIVTTVVPTTITESIGNAVIDVSIIPYMRKINILFVGKSFKPSTTLYPYFDNKNITEYTSNRISKFYLANNNIQLSVNLSNPEVVEIKNKDTSTTLASGLVVHTSNNIVYVSNIIATNSLDVTNLELVGSNTYSVIKHEHFGGTVSAANINSITLSLDAAGANNLTTSISGNTVYIVDGTGATQSRIIQSYNPSTRLLTVTTNWSTTPIAGDSQYAIGNLKTDESGSVVGIFTVPAGTFRVGEKLFRLMDSSVGDLSSSSTSGDSAFFAQGTLQTKQETFVSTIQLTIERRVVSDERVITDVTTSTLITTRTDWVDPIAQTFLISPTQYPEGIFLNKVRVCFKSKDDIIPITLQIRPSVNGYPSSSVIYPFGSVTLTPDKVNITETPSLDDETKYTDFIFDSPVYLSPEEHAIVLIANSNQYEMYVAEIGKPDLITNSLISEQPYGGSFFASQNSSTWTADQSMDFMFRLFRNSYNLTPSEVLFTIEPPQNSFNYSLVQTIASDIVLAKTALNYQYKTQKQSDESYTDFAEIIPGRDYELIDSNGLRILSNTAGPNTFTLKATLSSSDEVISPAIDVARSGILVVGNIINNLELSNTGFVIENSGDSYTNSSDVIITISGGEGSGAEATANVVGGIIDAVYLTKVGSGYKTTPTITLGRNYTSGTNASIRYIGETSPSGGNSTAKYICRKVTLADGFNSGDLRVYLTAYRPSGTGIYVYYKILSESDNETFESKSWQLMTQLGDSNYTSVNTNDYRELTFAPGTNGVADNSVSYSTGTSSYTTFKTFAIKIVMSSTTPMIVPKIRDFRAIALPAG